MKKKILTSVMICMFVFAAGTMKVHAGTADNTGGWLWGGAEDSTIAGVMGVKDDTNETGFDWISLNSINCDTNGSGLIDAGDMPAAGCPGIGTTVASYGVKTPLVAGPVTGYGWNGHVGWIDFNPSAHCVTVAPVAGQYQALSCTAPDGTLAPSVTVSRSATNTLTGWARIVSIAQATVTGNAGGLTGWIHMTGTGYAVSITPATGKMSNYASAGAGPGVDGLGYVNFSGITTVSGTPYGGQIIPPPAVTSFSANPLTINVDTNPNWNVGAGTPILLTWTLTNATSCTKSGGAWSGTTSTSGSETVNQNSANVTYTLSCSGPGGAGVPGTVNVISACYAKACSASATCSPVPNPTPASNSATCGPLNTCANNNDCATRASGQWKEVTP